MSTLAIYFGLMADTQEPQTEIDQQLKLVVENRHMVRNINIEHIKQQIKEELQIKNVKQHKARNHERSKTRPTNLTANTLDRRGLDETDARLNQLSEVQHGTKLFSWQVGLKKSQEDQMVSGERENSQEYQMVSSESFTQSKKYALKLVTQKDKK